MPCSVHALLKGAVIFLHIMSNAQLIDDEYNSIVTELSGQYENIDPFLLIKSAMLRRKYPAENKQHFWFELQYRDGINTDLKSAHIFNQVGKLPAYHGHNHFVLDIPANLDTLLSIASDGDIEYVSGEVFPL